MLFEEIIIYGLVFLIITISVVFYVKSQIKKSKIVEEKIKKAKEEGLHEPVSLHPVIDINECINTGACIIACPEQDILGVVNGKATTINTSRCIGHGACFHACPTEAISLCIGTEKRGVELPHVNEKFETNIPGIYIAGELGGMGLIRNAVEQGKQAVDNIAKSIAKNHQADYDLLVVGAGPAGISASLNAKKLKLKSITFEQDSLGGTVFTFPRNKIVMTNPMDLPLFGKVKLNETNKAKLLDVWLSAIRKNNIEIKENTRVETIEKQNEHFIITTNGGEKYTAKNVLLSIGRRGTPRKLNIQGEDLPKVAYRLLEPEDIYDKKIMVVGGGDSAIESAMLLADQNEVILSYRKDTFQRIKAKNKERIQNYIDQKKIQPLFNSNLTKIEMNQIELTFNDGSNKTYENDLVYIFAGGELPTQFLKNIGLQITKKHGEAILKH
jgi:thioredoxin reductase/Pyruvate/2-oxoacid:ferredoxin oxidoreductase delta subunit